MNKKVNELIPKALDAITNSRMAVNGKFEKEYKGYIASMGASIIQSGLIATLAFYSNVSEKTVKRKNVLDAILLLIAPNDQKDLLKYVLSKVKPNNAAALNSDELKKFEIKISDALIALKLALRTFKQNE